MSDEVKCPKCGSSSVDASLSGANLGMAALGTYSFGIVGGLAGAASGSKKVQCICKKCGCVWSPQKIYDENRAYIEKIKRDNKKAETGAGRNRVRELQDRGDANDRIAQLTRSWEKKEASNKTGGAGVRYTSLDKNVVERKKRNDPWPSSVKWQCFTSIVDGSLWFLVITLPLWFFFGLSVAAVTHAGLTVPSLWVCTDLCDPYKYDENDKGLCVRSALYVIVILIVVLSLLNSWYEAYDASH